MADEKVETKTEEIIENKTEEVIEDKTESTADVVAAVTEKIKDTLPDGKLAESKGDAPAQEPETTDGEEKPVESKVEDGKPVVTPEPPGKDDAGVVEGEAQPEEPAAAKPSDEFGDLPESTSEKTKERFATMKGKFDELHTNFETAQSTMNEIAGRFQNAGMNEEQFNMALDYVGDVNSGNPLRLRRAFDFMLKEVTDIGRVLGIPIGDFDPLDGYPDLKQEFEDGGISRERADELAGARATKNLADTGDQLKSDEQQAQTAHAQGIADLKALGGELAAQDPLYAQKLPQLEAAMEAVYESGSPPANWAAAIRKAYDKIQLVVPRPPAANVPDSIRPGAKPPSDSLHKQPSTALEAVEMAMRSLR